MHCFLAMSSKDGKTRVVYHLHGNSGDSIWKVNGTSIFRLPNRNFSGMNGLFEKVVLSDRLERFNRQILFHLHLFYFSPVLGSSRFNNWNYSILQCLPVSHSKSKAHIPNGIFYPKFCLPLAQFQTGWVFHVNGKQPRKHVS
jgi:hypothetical protein